MDEEPISTREAADRLGVSPGRIRALLTAKRLAGIKVGDRAWILTKPSQLARIKVYGKAGRPPNQSKTQ